MQQNSKHLKSLCKRRTYVFLLTWSLGFPSLQASKLQKSGTKSSSPFFVDVLVAKTCRMGSCGQVGSAGTLTNLMGHWRVLANLGAPREAIGDYWRWRGRADINPSPESSGEVGSE